LAPGLASAEAIKIGTLKISAYSPLFVAEEKGYFAAEGLAPELVYFNSAEPIALGIASGSLDFGVSGTSAGLFNLCGQGALRIIGGGPQEVPGFQFFVLLASNRSYEAGLKSFKDIGGHSAAVSQIGSPPHYSFALIAEKYGIDPTTIRILPLQAVPNQLSAVSGGQVDETIVNATSGLPSVQRGDAKLIGSVGNETPWQIGVLYTATKTANERSDIVARFLRAYRKGARDYHDAVTGADGKRADGPAASAIMATIAKYTGQTVEQIGTAIAYSDAEARLDLTDIAHQVAWFKAQNMVKAAVNADEVVDRRYAIALPQR
jgi:NitT/TauT family transport system substrate-binding protein